MDIEKPAKQIQKLKADDQWKVNIEDAQLYVAGVHRIWGGVIISDQKRFERIQQLEKLLKFSLKRNKKLRLENYQLLNWKLNKKRKRKLQKNRFRRWLRDRLSKIKK